MKNLYLPAMFMFGALSLNAQVNISKKMSRANENISFSEKAVNSTNNVAKAEGDLLWDNEFDVPADWTISAADVQGQWQIVTTNPTNPSNFSGYVGTMASTTAANGFAVFNGIQYLVAGNPMNQNAMITLANPINLSATANVNISFEQGYRAFNSDETWVEFSTNGGTSWSGFQVNTEYPSNSAYVQNTYSENVSSYVGGQASVLVRFRWTSSTANSGYAWMVDDVKFTESLINDVKLDQYFVATDVVTTNAFDYRKIPASQVSFPGLTFGAFATNNGSANQATVALNVTDGTYNETGTTVAIASGTSDSISVTVPYMVPTALGMYDLDITTTLGATTDSDLTNNAASISVERTNFVYARDNGLITSSISQISSQDGQELSIGNLMDVYDEMTVTNMQVRLTNQPAAVGQQFNSAIYIYDGTDYVYADETIYHDIVTGNLGTFVTLKFAEPVIIPAGSLVLAVAHHLGGADEVAFGMAQPTEEQTVIGFTAAGEPFSLTSPSTIMVRLNDDPSIGLSENELLNGVNVYPNPATNEANVEFNLANASNVEIKVLDVTGKTIETITIDNAAAGANNANLNVANYASGIYNVTISSNEASVTKKFVKK